MKKPNLLFAGTAHTVLSVALAVAVIGASPVRVLAEEGATQPETSVEEVDFELEELAVAEDGVEDIALTATAEDNTVLAPQAPTTVGWVEEGGSWTYYDVNGVKQYGFVQVASKWYYLNPDNYGYLVENSTFESGGVKYVADENGVCPSNKWVKVGSNWYYTKANHGVVVSGWMQLDGKHYYLDNNGILKTGLFSVSGKNYIADDNGVCKESSWIQFEGDWYLTDASCACRTGWALDKGTWYYLHEGGDMATGWLTTDGKTYYYLDPSGAMVTGWKKISGVWYFFKDSGSMATGWLFNHDSWYYLDPSNGAMKAGTIFNDGKHDYIAKPNGECPVNGWVKQDGAWYRTDGSCAIRTGWYQVDGVWYYSESDGKMVENTVFTDSKGNWYIATASGACPANSWVKCGGDWYFTSDSCSLRFGWIQYKEDWYYLDKTDGHMLADTTTPDGYKVDADGKWVK